MAASAGHHGSSSPPPNAVAALRCVLWHGDSGEFPGDLLTSLSKRFGRMIVCTDAYSALAECCLIERARTVDIAAGNPTPIGGVLVLVHPSHLVGITPLAESALLYAPSIAMWSYDRNANPRLRAVVEEEVIAAPHRAPSIRPAPAAPVPVARPASRPAPAPARPGAPAARPSNGTPVAHAQAPQSRPARASTLLTEEELRMLLTPIPPPAAHRSAGEPGR